MTEPEDSGRPPADNAETLQQIGDDYRAGSGQPEGGDDSTDSDSSE